MTAVPVLNAAAALASSYLLGSIPSAIWIARLGYGIDIRQVGSRNPGMTNVLRVLGWKPAVPVALLDALKGFLAPWLAWTLTASASLALACGFLAVLGHSFSCFASFRGGKGVLTAFGVFLYFVPTSSLTALAAWMAVVSITRYVSLGSITAALILPLSIYLESRFRGDPGLFPVLAVAGLVAAFVLYRHRGNMARLANGTENKFGSKGGWQERT